MVEKAEAMAEAATGEEVTVAGVMVAAARAVAVRAVAVRGGGNPLPLPSAAADGGHVGSHVSAPAP